LAAWAGRGGERRPRRVRRGGAGPLVGAEPGPGRVRGQGDGTAGGPGRAVRPGPLLLLLFCGIRPGSAGSQVLGLRCGAAVRPAAGAALRRLLPLAAGAVLLLLTGAAGAVLALLAAGTAGAAVTGPAGVPGAGVEGLLPAGAGVGPGLRVDRLPLAAGAGVGGRPVLRRGPPVLPGARGGPGVRGLVVHLLALRGAAHQGGAGVAVPAVHGVGQAAPGEQLEDQDHQHHAGEHHRRRDDQHPVPLPPGARLLVPLRPRAVPVRVAEGRHGPGGVRRPGRADRAEHRRGLRVPVPAGTGRGVRVGRVGRPAAVHHGEPRPHDLLGLVPAALQEVLGDGGARGAHHAHHRGAENRSVDPEERRRRRRGQRRDAARDHLRRAQVDLLLLFLIAVAGVPRAARVRGPVLHVLFGSGHPPPSYALRRSGSPVIRRGAATTPGRNNPITAQPTRTPFQFRSRADIK